MRFLWIVVLSLMFSCGTPGWAQDIQPYKIFSSNMVLQRERPIRISGTAPAGTKVTVRFAGKTAAGAGAGDGEWQVEFPAMEAGGPYEMTFEGKGTPVTFSNVMVGEVWLCSGQSNMEFPMKIVSNAKKEIAAANYPNLRLYPGNIRQVAAVPQRNINASWKVCTPKTVSDFSAVAYFFGRELLKELKVPVGLINVSRSGTPIELWTSPCGFQAIPSLKEIYEVAQTLMPGTPQNRKATQDIISKTEKWLVQAKKDQAEGKLITRMPKFPSALKRSYSFLYNTMIAPVRPFSFRGVLWYQGCANVRDGSIYKDKMHALMTSWRKEFNDPALPIYFAQLAPYIKKRPSDQLPVIWEAQQAFADSDPNAHMAVINDIGNLQDIHPRNKQDVGKRLALLALKYQYGQDIAADSPFYESRKVDGNKMIVTFRNAKQLKTRDGKAPNFFEIAGEDGVFFPGKAEISGNQVILTSDKVIVPARVRFAWDQAAEPNLCNEAGLPAGAFRAGKVPVRDFLDMAIPEAKNFQVLYAYNPLKPLKEKEAEYFVDNTSRFRSLVPKKVAYFVRLTCPDGKKQYVFVSMDAFSGKLRELGVPTAEINKPFQKMVNDLFVKSNVPGVKNGTFTKGNVEFWKDNYTSANAMKIPNASGKVFDFGDQRATSGGAYGSMQVHNFLKKQTVFAYNCFSGNTCDIGIGNAPDGNPDWTFSANGKNLVSAVILILVR